MIRAFRARINFSMKESHPDIKTVKENKNLSFEDIYSCDENYFWDKEEMISYIKRDLRLVASGGYNFDHLKDVSFDIQEIGA